jgi:uncharacterized protein with PIN domain
MSAVSTPQPRFLADRMLGRLGKWLRIMGVDCAYTRLEDDEETIEKALEEGRILLSRDTKMLSRKRLPEHLFVESDHLERQLIQVLSIYRIDPVKNAFCRCVRCNTRLERKTPEQAGDRVPYFVRQTQDNLAYCPACNRYFWGATHRSKMRTRLEQIQEALQAGSGNDG